MIAYHIGGYFLMAAIFCAMLGGSVTFNIFASIGAFFIIVGFLWEWFK